MNLRLVHHHPGRLRVRSRALVGTNELTEHACSALRSTPGVREVTHNASTGSLALDYAPELVEADTLLGRLGELTGLPVVFGSEGGDRRDMAVRILHGARELNNSTHEMLGARADLRILVPAALAAAAAASFVLRKSQRWPRWDTLLFGSLNLFTQWHQSEIARYAYPWEVGSGGLREVHAGGPRR